MKKTPLLSSEILAGFEKSTRIKMDRRGYEIRYL